MAWIAPVTDRASAVLLTPADMDRITGDVAYLQEETIGTATISQTSWANDDIITVAFWSELLGDITELLTATGTTGATMTNSMDYENLNAVETNLQRLYGQTADVTDFTVYGVSVAEDGGEVDLNDYTLLDSETVTAISGIGG